MKRTLLLLCVMVFSQAHAQHPARLKIIHWNDFHAQNTPVVKKDAHGKTYSVGGFAYFKAAIDSLKRAAELENEPVLLLDAGDNFQGTAISGFTRGASQIKLMNIIHPDAVTLGNHEFDYGWMNIDSLIRFKAIYDVTCANIERNDGKPFVQQFLLKQVGTLSVAIIGLTTDDLENLTLPWHIQGLTIARCAATLKIVLPEIKKLKPDLIIVLSHIGVEADRKLATQFPEVNIFVGGHSHTPLEKPIRESHSLIVQAGSRGQYVGELDLTIDTDADSVLTSDGRLIETVNDKFSPNRAIVEQIELVEKPINIKLGETIAILKKDWKIHRPFASNLASYEAMVFREDLHSEIGVINYGGLRKSLTAGDITMRDMYEINPFGNELVQFDLTGAEIKQVLERMFGDSGREACEFSGILCKVDTNQSEGKRISVIRIGDADWNPKKKYLLTTNIYIATHLHSFFGIEESSHPLKHTGITDFDLLVEGTRKRKMISGESEPWIIWHSQ
ncbi:MAG: bifunctional UDP-sugar hydrolase/5'-nucleotidase [Ignavibacteriota bacterium]